MISLRMNFDPFICIYRRPSVRVDDAPLERAECRDLSTFRNANTVKPYPVPKIVRQTDTADFKSLRKIRLSLDPCG